MCLLILTPGPFVLTLFQVSTGILSWG